MKTKLTSANIRSSMATLNAASVPKEPWPAFTPQLSVGGVVMLGGHGFMHPEQFREIAGEEAYQELLKRPRIVSEYD